MNSVDVPSLSHLDETGQARMVDVGDKVVTARVAVCEARVRMSPGAFGQLADHAVAKGDVLNTARVAGVLAAKRCAELIPLCHTLPLSFVGIDFALEAEAGSVRITATCRSDYKTGVEMEAMMACSVAALTIYDMCKAADKGIVVEAVRLLYKAGGKSGAWLAPDLTEPPAAAFALGAASDGLPRQAAARGQADVPAPAAAASSRAPASRLNVAAPGDRAASLPEPSARAVAAPTGTASAGAALRLVFFARIAEQVGTREQTWPWAEPGTGEQLLRALGERFPQIEPVSRLKLAVNQQHARLDTRIVPGDEVAVFEPVTGG